VPGCAERGFGLGGAPLGLAQLGDGLGERSELAADLTWPKLRRQWAVPHPPGPDLTAGERADLWEHAARVADEAASQIQAWSVISPDAATDAAWAAGDALQVTAAALGSSVLRQAAEGSIVPPASSTGASLHPARSAAGSGRPPG
jgi:hypothetical protein